MRLEALVGDRFEIEHQIGTGGMGEVFRARDRLTGEIVALKILSEGRGHRTARFEREVELLAELSHPGIVRYVAHGETSSGELFLAMELLDGEDLNSRLERAPPTMSEAVKLAMRVAEALGAAHARGIVHRDLKPSNLFLPGGRLEQVKVLDFGIAFREGGDAVDPHRILVGTPGYMAPEQAHNDRVIDARADVFAMGCVLFQCLTGTPPFAGDSAAAILSKILFGEAPRVSELWPEVPEDLDALVAQMLAKEPSLRPSDGTHLAAALATLSPRVHSATAAPWGRVVRAPSLTSGERRLLSVVLLGRATEQGWRVGAGRRGAAAGAQAVRRPDRAARRWIDDRGARGRPAGGDRSGGAGGTLRARATRAREGSARSRSRWAASNRRRKPPEGDVIDRASRLLSHAAKGPGRARRRSRWTTSSPACSTRGSTSARARRACRCAASAR